MNTTKQKITKSKAKTTVPLIVESHPIGYTGLPFITLVQYRKQPLLVIVDNATKESIQAFVLDLCGPERVDEEAIVIAAKEWYNEERSSFPLSIAFSRKGMTSMTSKIYRSLNVDYVTRVIGPLPSFPMNTVKSVKRRRRKAIPPAALVA